jgi:murein L,D-transpeptidase YafK
MYKVTKKKKGVQTRYYKALLINYPNEQDVIEFKNSVKKGILSKRAKSGGLIEIHGDGGKGFDWTNGCVALTNSDMDRIYDIASIGMPVNIVGSLTSLNEILSGLK